MTIPPAAMTPARRSGRTALVAVVLAFAAGATDAFAFLQLSGVFTANMTGNLVLGGLIGAVLIHADPLYGAALPILPAITAAVLTAITVTTARHRSTLLSDHMPLTSPNGAARR